MKNYILKENIITDMIIDLKSINIYFKSNLNNENSIPLKHLIQYNEVIIHNLRYKNKRLIHNDDFLEYIKDLKDYIVTISNINIENYTLLNILYKQLINI